MAKTRQEKEVSVQTLVDNIKTSKSLVFANFQGLKVKESEELRALCKKENIVFVASKKTLIGKALEQAGYNIDVKGFEGSVAMAFGTEDEIAPAKVLADFAKKHEVLKIYGGTLEGAFIDSAKVTALAKLPTKQQLLGQLVGTLQAPVSGFVNVLAGNIRGLVNVLNAVKDKQA